MEQEEQPSFRRYVEDRRYYEVPARFALNTAYMEVSYDAYIYILNNTKLKQKCNSSQTKCLIIYKR